MDYTTYQTTSGQDRPNQSPPTPLQPSWNGPPADARIERVLARLNFMTEKATELALAVHARAMDQLATPSSKPELPARRAPNTRGHAHAHAHEDPPACRDPGLLFARLFHLITRAGTVETAIAERRRTQDQRDRLADTRAARPAEQSRRVCTQRNVRALVEGAIAATGQPLAAYQQALNHRMADPDIAALLATHQAAAIAATLCRDLAIPSATPTPVAPHSAQSPDDLSSREMDALLRSILTHPSLDRPAPSREPP